MKNTLQKSKKVIREKVEKLLNASFNDDAIVAFEEKQDVVSDKADKRPCAHDLFSLFTADVIKKSTLFVR